MYSRRADGLRLSIEYGLNYYYHYVRTFPHSHWNFIEAIAQGLHSIHNQNIRVQVTCFSWPSTFLFSFYSFNAQPDRDSLPRHWHWMLVQLYRWELKKTSTTCESQAVTIDSLVLPLLSYKIYYRYTCTYTSLVICAVNDHWSRYGKKETVHHRQNHRWSIKVQLDWERSEQEKNWMKKRWPFYWRLGGFLRARVTWHPTGMHSKAKENAKIIQPWNIIKKRQRRIRRRCGRWSWSGNSVWREDVSCVACRYPRNRDCNKMQENTNIPVSLVRDTVAHHVHRRGLERG